VFCVDEKTAIQALDRLDPVLPLSPGRAERHGFEYYRHGTLSLYAALDTATGRVHGKTAARHTSRDFVVFLKEVVALCPPDQQIQIILDNLSAHKTALVRGVPGAESPRLVPLHTHLLLMAQPGRTLVRENRAGGQLLGVGLLPEKRSLAWWAHSMHLLAKMLLNLASHEDRYRPVLRRSESEE
jgi:hypothetical protein